MLPVGTPPEGDSWFSPRGGRLQEKGLELSFFQKHRDVVMAASGQSVPQALLCAPSERHLDELPHLPSRSCLWSLPLIIISNHFPSSPLSEG